MLECVKHLHDIGLQVILFICDQGSNNRVMMTQLGISVPKPWFTDSEGHKVFVMYDTPHLIKNPRNNFKKYGFTFQNSMAKWKFVEDLYMFDSRRQIRMAPKLTSKHINVPPFKTMSVKLATQVLSHTVAASISTLCDLGKWPEDEIVSAKATAQFIDNMDSLFNVFNSKSMKDPHILR